MTINPEDQRTVEGESGDTYLVNTVEDEELGSRDTIEVSEEQPVTPQGE